MADGNALAVCLLLDRHYLLPAKVAFGSLLLNSSQALDVKVIVASQADVDVVEEEFSQVLSRLATSGKGSRGTFQVIAADEFMPRVRAFPINDKRKNLTATTYLKFYIPDLIEADRVLYLDVDTLVLGDIAEIDRASRDMPHPIAASLNSGPPQKRWRKLASRYGIAPERYFNAGVMVMDLKRMRESRARAELEEVVRKNSELLKHRDQDAINVVFADRIHELEPRFNFHDFSLGMKDGGRAERILGLVSQASIGDASIPPSSPMPADTVICHYSGDPKPWQPMGYLCRSRSDLWEKFARQVLPDSEILGLYSLRRRSMAYAFRALQISRLAGHAVVPRLID